MRTTAATFGIRGYDDDDAVLVEERMLALLTRPFSKGVRGLVRIRDVGEGFNAGVRTLHLAAASFGVQ